MEFYLFDGGEDGEYNHVSFVEVFKVFVEQNAFFFGTEPFDRVYK